MINRVRQFVDRGGAIILQRVSFTAAFGVLFLLSFFILLQGDAAAENGDACAGMVCGEGYYPEVQENGTCLCILADCDDMNGYPELPSASGDCDDTEGCPEPPPTINP